MKRFYFVWVISTLIILTGCNFNKQFTEMLEGNVDKIVVETDTSDPSKVLIYSTSNKEVISDFLYMMDSMPFKKTYRNSGVFKEKFELYNENNELIKTVTFVGENIALINDQTYEIDEVKLRSFTDEFYTDKYLVK